jgi:hypothetical protein
VAGSFLGAGLAYNFTRTFFLGLEGRYLWTSQTDFDFENAGERIDANLTIEGIQATLNIGFRFYASLGPLRLFSATPAFQRACPIICNGECCVVKRKRAGPGTPNGLTASERRAVRVFHNLQIVQYCIE